MKIQKKFGKRKKNFFQQVKTIRPYQLNRKPSLIIIPDVFNNEMIVKETNIRGIPVLGLVNSDCQTEIAYPIFANDLSLYSIHFFCNFLSALITKELVKHKRKLYIVRKKRQHLKSPQVKRYIFRSQPRSYFSRLKA